ncbi:MAG TPA: ABC transporter permease [Firmicutes bacterium]|nr:ABC transporter permease [Bacillota bacterium]
MKRYLVLRFIRSLFSIFMVVTIVFAMIYSFIPRDRVFFSDPLIGKLQKRPDDYAKYQYNTWEKLGYLEYETINEYCEGLYGAATDAYSSCILSDSTDTTEFTSEYTKKGFTVELLPESGLAYAYRETPILTRVFKWWGSLISFDHPYKVQDDTNVTLERKVYIGKDHNNRLALMCSGCESKYLVYFNGSFPYIHQNFMTFSLGYSYPTYSGEEILDVIGDSQGAKDASEITLPNGTTANSALNLYSCQYKSQLDNIDQKQFIDNYANCKTFKEDPSMMGISFTIGVISIILVYFLAIPIGVQMANHKGKLVDRIGNWYIVFMMAIPSLAYISLVRFIGSKYFGMPGMFPMLGSSDWRSYVLPVISLTLGQAAGLMMWTRRYVVDQSNMDYVKFAKAKGLSNNEIFNRHILRNAIGPIVHGIPGSIIFCIAGALITEAVYAIPGMGKILPDSIAVYNNSMVIGITFMFTTLAIISVFLGDILLTIVDPRISLHDKGGRR